MAGDFTTHRYLLSSQDGVFCYFFSSGRSDPADVLCIGDFVNLPSLSEVSNVLQNNICTFFVMTVSPLFRTLSSVYNADFPFLG
jgi:hypothetical protein